MFSYKGDKVKLRPLCREDIEESVNWRNDPKIRENIIGYRFPVTVEIENKWYQNYLDNNDNSRINFSIEIIGSKVLAGYIYLNDIDWISRHCQFGIMIGKSEHQGKGFGSDAMNILFNYAFECLNLRKICLEVASYNNNAISLYKKTGFSNEGILKEHLYLNGRHHDIILMSLFLSKK